MNSIVISGRPSRKEQTSKSQVTARDSAALDPIKRSVGRPSKYDPAYCERVIELATSEGLSWGRVRGRDRRF
jgi:hypothetical protein